MAYDNIRSLIDRYFEGDTSIAEEQQIAHFFAQCDDIPDDLRPIRDMFAALSQLQKIESPVTPITAKTEIRHRSRTIWMSIASSTAVAASLICGILIFDTNRDVAVSNQAPAIIYHVNGQRIYDHIAAQEATSQTLSILSDNILLAMAEVEKIKIMK